MAKPKKLTGDCTLNKEKWGEKLNGKKRPKEADKES